ncbi:MAG: bifunctional helix-turn-helix transcriptional regulator/GNAT family N-acetyltransferase [Acidobacteriota bacterium]
MDFYRHLGPMAIGSRLRALTARITEDAAQLYALYGSPLDPRWFPVVYVLAHQGPLPVGEIGRIIGHSHASVSQILKAMTKAGLATSERSAEDRRQRLARLTEAGHQAVDQMAPQRRDVSAAVDDILGAMSHDLWAALGEVEAILDRQSLYERVARRFHASPAGEVAVRDFEAGDGPAFERLNREWIDAYFEIEEQDLRYLQNPEATILEPGGQILMALHRGEVVGTCALIKMDDGGFELAKMAVTPSAQGLGIGALLGRAVIERARQLGAPRAFLESNRRLAPALQLYRKLGFVEVENQPSGYSRSDIQMEIRLNDRPASAS